MRTSPLPLLLVALAPTVLSACRDKDAGVLAPDTGAANSLEDADGDGYLSDEDCDDDNAEVFPGAQEACNGIDDDCNGETDEGLTGVFYDDADGDGYGDPTTPTEACEAGEGQVDNPDDCDDTAASIHPDASEACNDLDDDCDGSVDEDVRETWYLDADADGHGDPEATWDDCAPPPGYIDTAGDCNDRDPTAYPGAEEVCDGDDEDCDGDIDEGVTTTFYVDADGDGYGSDAGTLDACTVPSGYAESNDDCDDDAIGVNPGADELCNGDDDDCDDAVDEDDAVDATTWYADADLDTYGDPSTGTVACEAPAGGVSDNTDCNDADGDLNPDTVWYLDYDSDGYGGTRVTLTQCDQPSSYVRSGSDCDDLDADINPGETEICNGEDDDCDGDTDDDDTSVDTTTGSIFYADTDTDGFGDSDTSQFACAQSAGWVDDATDCDDGQGTVYPGASELCDGLDNDCDLATDEGVLGVDLACAALSCDEILADDPTAADGAYYLDPDGNGAFLNHCDMTDDGGGWTLVFACDADDVGYGSGWDGWWQDGNTTTLDDTSDRGKSLAFDESDVEEVRITATYPDASVVVFNTGTVLNDLHDIIGSEITTCSGLTGSGRYSYTASTYSGSYFQSSSVAVVACDTDGSSLETTGDNHYDAAIFSTYTNHGDYNYADGSLGTEFTCAGSQYSYGIASNTVSLWVR